MPTKSRITTKEKARTKKKVGMAVYFTFIATFALCFGAQLWMIDVFNPKESAPTQPYSVENTQTPQGTKQNYSTEDSSPVSYERTALDNNDQQNEPNVEDESITPSTIDTYRNSTI